VGNDTAEGQSPNLHESQSLAASADEGRSSMKLERSVANGQVRPEGTHTPPHDPLLILSEIAGELRCSKAHASKIIQGKVRGVSILPAIRIGSRPVVRRSTFERWKAENESRAGSCYAQHARNSRDERMGDKHA
jgi:hypothetical protein